MQTPERERRPRGRIDGDGDHPSGRGTGSAGGMNGGGPWRFYLLACADGTLYAGITNDLARRLALHNSGRASRYTRARRPVTLLYAEPHPDRSSAARREAQVRRMSRGAKLALAGHSLSSATVVS